MKKIALIGLVLMLGGCAMTPGSWTRAGINEKFTNCLVDALDPQNRGSGCN